MHYRNGREAKAGDSVVDLLYGKAGILHTVVPSSTTCNGRLATVGPNDPYVNISDCMHIEDVAAAFPAKPQGETTTT